MDKFLLAVWLQRSQERGRNLAWRLAGDRVAAGGASCPFLGTGGTAVLPPAQAGPLSGDRYRRFPPGLLPAGFTDQSKVYQGTLTHSI
ncbi:hypothetical protein [Kamptonema formosum]|uniref:hypothetical protein n=1 Tax=Kamptonema formosum TaxID=331992 RepID=UPI0012DE14C3|nr:hypothetical protein [Oscillatoria sp. PCC 10802]